VRLEPILFAGILIAGPVPALAAAPPAQPSSAVSTAAVQPAPAKPAPAAKPQKATPEQRAEADRMTPLARAAFWAREADIDPKDDEARLELARALRVLGKYDEAASAAEQLLIVRPDNLEALLESARDRIGGGQGFYAIEPAQRAEAVAPRDWRPVSLLAIALEQSDRDDEALEAHQKALALAPHNPATLTNLGLYYASHGDPEHAEPLLREAASAFGAGAQERQNLALVLGLEGHVSEAEQLERQDLPPDIVANNLAYLKAADDPASADGRTWSSLRSVQ